jgi:hypothetical protein
LDQQIVKVLPFQSRCSLGEAKEGREEVNGNLLKVLRLGGSERCADPLDIWFVPPKMHILEF